MNRRYSWVARREGYMDEVNLPPEFVELLNSVTARRPRTVIDHILSVNTMRAGLSGPDQHIEAIRRFKEVVR